MRILKKTHSEAFFLIHFMTASIEQVKIYSESGDGKYPNDLVAKMDGSQPDCPITFYSGGVPVFSLGADEVAEFCEELSKLVP